MEAQLYNDIDVWDLREANEEFKREKIERIGQKRYDNLANLPKGGFCIDSQNEVLNLSNHARLDEFSEIYRIMGNYINFHSNKKRRYFGIDKKGYWNGGDEIENFNNNVISLDKFFQLIDLPVRPGDLVISLLFDSAKWADRAHRFISPYKDGFIVEVINHDFVHFVRDVRPVTDISHLEKNLEILKKDFESQGFTLNATIDKSENH